jgi:hypothetical protein
MALEVEIISPAKGSNPGGVCNISCLSSGSSKQFYIKYCPGSHLPRESFLCPSHQPIYEAITSVRVNQLGLTTPNNWVLANGDLHFKGDSQLLRKINQHMPYYFVSEMIPTPHNEDSEKTKLFMSQESFYRDILHVSDIVGKKQNYFFIDDEKGGHLAYIDVGCNFVNATGGFMFFNHDIKTHAPRVDLRRDMKRLKEYSLMPALVQASDFISLADFVTISPEMEVPLIDSKDCRKKGLILGNVLCEQEREEITRILAYGVLKHLKDIRASDLVVRA